MVKIFSSSFKTKLWFLILLIGLALLSTACESGPMGATGGKSSGGESFSGKRLEAIKADDVFLMSSPSFSASKVMALERAATVEVSKQEGDWLGVTTTDGKSGWVHGGYVTGFGISRPDL
ncbi:MAG: SH3 domain-containing protein [Deltaproteobacteria bacterium]|nr:SH3 domain-containing protein [Deltaproteobacteria bacterium]